MDKIIIVNDRGETVLKVDYTQDIENRLQYILAEKQNEVQNGA